MSKTRIKSILLGSSLLIMILMWFFFIHKPIIDQFLPLETEIDNIRNQMRIATEMGDNIDTLLAQLDYTRNETIMFKNSFPVIFELDSILGVISQSAVDHDLIVQSLDPTVSLNLFDNPSLFDAEAVQGLIKMPVDMRAQGEYLKFGEFLENLDALGVIHTIEDLRLRSTAEELPNLTFQVVIYLYFKYPLDATVETS